MNVKVFIYIIMFFVSLFSVDCIKYDAFLKTDNTYKIRFLMIIIDINLTYLSINFMNDIIINTKII